MLEQMVEDMWCDIVNFEKKIVIEFNGDIFHANPLLFNKDDYIPLIQMIAKEKWKKDRAKNFRLRRLGWQVIVIWEYEWNNHKENVIKKIQNILNINLPKWWENTFTTKTKHMKNEELDINKCVELKEVKNYLELGWKFGFIKRKKDNK